MTHLQQAEMFIYNTNVHHAVPVYRPTEEKWRETQAAVRRCYGYIRILAKKLDRMEVQKQKPSTELTEEDSLKAQGPFWYRATS